MKIGTSLLGMGVAPRLCISLALMAALWLLVVWAVT